MNEQASYRRVLLKLSGEALMGPEPFGWHQPTMEMFAAGIRAVQASGVQVCVVVGGGNIFRGLSNVSSGYDRANADYMGMLATVMNGMALHNALEQSGVDARVQSAIPMPAVCEPYIRRRAIRHLERGRVVILAAGTGNPFFTTDTAAALRAVETGCDALFKGTQVDGVYSADPKKDTSAVRFDSLSYQDVLSQDLRVMDAAAIALARESRLPVIVFAMKNANAFPAAVRGEGTFTIVK
ncbi:MAG: UMP kinase [Rhodospirillales bacterium]|nr:UMP kinase [Rhodospirillales bacterium]